MTNSIANSRQVAGTHYKGGEYQHWDFVANLGLNYFIAQTTKYLCRWRNKNGVEDLKKAQHYLQKFMELAGNPSIEEYITSGADRLCVDTCWRGLLGRGIQMDEVINRFCKAYHLTPTEQLMVHVLVTATRIEQLRAVDETFTMLIAHNSAPLDSITGEYPLGVSAWPFPVGKTD